MKCAYDVAKNCVGNLECSKKCFNSEEEETF